MDIKPIETVYNGYRFRSRLEARWAVFFDAAGIPYEYEPQGFILSDGTKYLPDFYLPWFKAFVEIKPQSIKLDEDALAKAEEKCTLLFTDGPDCIVLLCFGDPVDMDIEVNCIAVHEPPFNGPITEPWCDQAAFIEGATFDNEEWGYSKHCISIIVGIPNYTDDIGITTSKGPNVLPGEFCGIAIDSRHRLYGYRSDLMEYRKKARQVRFEHGETPRVKG